MFTAGSTLVRSAMSGAALLILSGCILPLPITAVTVVADGFSYATSGKSITDHYISHFAKADCAMHRPLQGQPVCSPVDTMIADADASAEIDPMIADADGSAGIDPAEALVGAAPFEGSSPILPASGATLLPAPATLSRCITYSPHAICSGL